MRGKTCEILVILLLAVVGSAISGYSSQSKTLKGNSAGSGSNYIELNGTAIDNESIRVRTEMLKVPLSFIENRGQVSQEARFMVKTLDRPYSLHHQKLFSLCSVAIICPVAIIYLLSI